ncbi:MAG: DUF4351 domain-containing protein [Gemmataceae bacterium]
MADHDQRLKSVVRERLADAVALVFAPWAAALDLAAPRWLETELFPDPPSGERREVDLIARVPVRGGGEALVHLEVEARDSLTSLRERMPRYHHYLGFKHGLPVLSLAVYAQVGLEGTGWDEARGEFQGETLSLTRWPYLGLRALDGVRYAEGGNLLGVAFVGLMRVPDGRKPRVKADALRRLAEAELTDISRYLLMEVVEAYLPLDGPLMQQYRDLLMTKEYAAVLKAAKTTFEMGEERGEEKARRSLVLKLLTRRFGPLSAVALQRLAAYPPERLEELGEALLTAASLAELGLEDPY